MTAVNGFCFVFVCQAGDLETKAVLLAASLRRHLLFEHELVAAVPTPESKWGRLSPRTIGTLGRLRVRIEPIVNRVSLNYPIGNKIDCLAVPTERSKIIFLDSDMLLLRYADLSGFRDVQIGAVPASIAHVVPADWHKYYLACEVSAPSSELRTLVSGEPSLPYFNSGFILADRMHASRLADEWAACARRLLELDTLPPLIRARFLDQVALPIAARRLGLPITQLPADWNFPSWGMTIGHGSVPALFHYQHLANLMRERVTEKALFELIDDDGEIGREIFTVIREFSKLE